MAFLAESGLKKYWFQGYYTGGDVHHKNWVYITQDALGTVLTTGYVDNTEVIQKTSIGDVVRVFVCTNRDNLSTQTAVYTIKVTAKSSTSLTLATDSDLINADLGFYSLTDPQFGGVARDGTTDDETAADAFIAFIGAGGGRHGRVPPGTYLATGLSASSLSPFTMEGAGREISIFRRDSDGGNFLAITSMDGVLLADFGLDLRYATNGDSGHGITATDCDDLTIRGVKVENFGNNGGSAGTGVIAAPSSQTNVSHVVFEDIFVDGDVTTSTDTNGTLISEGRYCRQSGIIAKNIKDFGVEYKNDTRYSLISDVIAYNCEFGVGYGQQTGGDDGCDFNVATGIVTYACDQGMIIGEGDFNLTANIIANSTDATGTDLYGVHDSSDTTGNLYWGVLTFGTNMDYPVRYRGTKGYCAIASHDTATHIVTLDAGTSKNVTQILHPGARTSIESAINDSSGNAINTANGNPVFCPATGEFIGSLSGRFKFKLGTATGLSPVSSQKFLFEHDTDAILLCAVSSATGATAGLQVAKGATSTHGGWFYALASDYWSLRVNNGDVGRFAATVWRAESDNAVALGASGQRFTDVFAVQATVGNVYSQSVTLADDTATSITMPGASSCAIVTVNCSTATNPAPRGSFWARATASPSIANIAMASATSITFTTGALAGTTGVDGEFTFATHTDGKLYLENRSGASRTIALLFSCAV